MFSPGHVHSPLIALPGFGFRASNSALSNRIITHAPDVRHFKVSTSHIKRANRSKWIKSQYDLLCNPTNPKYYPLDMWSILRNISEILYISFSHLSVQRAMCILWLQDISIWTSRIWYAQELWLPSCTVRLSPILHPAARMKLLKCKCRQLSTVWNMSLVPHYFRNKSTRASVIGFQLTSLNSLLTISSCVEPPSVTNILLFSQIHRCLSGLCAFAQMFSFTWNVTPSLSTSLENTFLSKTQLQCLLLLKPSRIYPGRVSPTFLWIHMVLWT